MSGEESLGKRGYKHKQYLREPTLPVPKTTTWRHNKKSKTALNHDNASTSSTTCSSAADYCYSGRRKRRLFNKSSQFKIPRQTAWSWKRCGGETFNFRIISDMKIPQL